MRCNLDFLGYGQKGNIIINFSVKKSDIDRTIGHNLKRLRLAAKLTQEQLAIILEVSSSGLIPQWEAGTKGVGKNVMTKLCDYFNVRPYEFYIENDTPLPATELEKKALYTIREAETLGVEYVAEEAIEYTAHRLDVIKKQAEEGIKPGKPSRLKINYIE